MAKTKPSDEAENGDNSSAAETTAPSSASAVLENDNISTRVGTRTKKAKVVFDPSDNYVPRKRVRKSEPTATDSPPTGASTKAEPMVPKSPAKMEKSHDNNHGNAVAAKSRLTLSPTVAKQSTSHFGKTKVFGPAVSPDITRLAGPSNANTSAPSVRKQEFKREPICDMCHKVEQLRRGFKLIDCSNCAFRAHSKCLRAHPVYSKFPIQLNFRCFQCIDCVVCGKSLRGGNLLFCCDCQNAFHQNCHGPTVSDHHTNGPWVCNQCTRESTPVKQPRTPEKPSTPRQELVEAADDEAHQEFAGFSDNEIRKDSFSLSDGVPANETDEQAEIKEEHSEDDDDENNEPNNVDDGDEEKFDPRLDNFENVQNWSCDDVYRYFKHYFPDYAHLFKEQEIDGSSLVLMRKSDVLSGFGLKLGPAISLYQRIVMMQSNDRDLRLTWI